MAEIGIPAADLPLPGYPHYTIEHFGDRYGLGAITVVALAQDRQGFLWMGTQTGVLRYDGSNVKRYGVAEGLPCVYTTELLVAPDGALWARTRKGLARLEGRLFKTVPVPAEAVRLSEVSQSFTVDNAGTLFAATEGGLLRLESKDSRAHLYNRADGLPSDLIEAIVRGPDDTIWFAAGRRLGRIPSGSLQPEILDSLELPADPVRSLIVDGNGKLWVRSENHLATLESKAPFPQELVFLDQGVPGANIEGGPSLDRRGNLMLPTSSGLYRWLGDRWQILDRKSGLTSSAVFAALEDQEGSVWIGLAGAGLGRWPGSNQWSGWTDAEGLPDSLILGVLRDQRSRLWVATNNGLALWDAGQARWMVWDKSNGLPAAGVRYILLSKDKAVWALALRRGLVRFDASRSDPAPVPVPLPGGYEQLGSMAAAPDGSVWTNGPQALHVIRYQAGRFAFEEVPVPPENAGTTAVVSFSPGGTLWTGGPNGVSRFDGSHWKRFDQRDGLLSNDVHNVYAVRDDEVWIGYRAEDSITRARWGADGRIRVDHFPKGVCVLGVDRNQGVWLEMDDSAAMLSPDGTLRNFTQRDGLLWNDVNCNAFWQESDGTILIGTSHGLARYDSAQEGLPRTPPSVVLTGARFAYTERLEETKPSVPYRERAFAAQFAALTFRDSDLIRCRYRLNGLESDFTETTLREARYSALPPGEYTFEVACGSPELGWSAKPATYSFTVEPPWWRRWWAGLAAIVLLALLIAGITRYRTRLLETERKRLEAAVAARSVELAQANQELQEVSLTDPLTGVRNRRFFYTTISADANQALRAYRSYGEGYSQDHRDLIFYLVDVDHFKEVNDRHGHDAGDQILVQVARRLRRIVRQSDFLIRWGGEEFLVVCRSAERNDAPVFVERILAAVAKEPFEIADGKTVKKTCSVGWAPYPWAPSSGETLSVDEVLKLADRGLYRAKELGRNQGVGILPGEAPMVSVTAGAPQEEAALSGSKLREVISSGSGSA